MSQGCAKNNGFCRCRACVSERRQQKSPKPPSLGTRALTLHTFKAQMVTDDAVETPTNQSLLFLNSKLQQKFSAAAQTRRQISKFNSDHSWEGDIRLYNNFFMGQLEGDHALKYCIRLY